MRLLCFFYRFIIPHERERIKVSVLGDIVRFPFLYQIYTVKML